MKCDLHMHSNYSDGFYSISQLVDLHAINGFKVISITDHLCESNGLIGRFSHKFNLSLNEISFKKYMEEIKREQDRAWSKYEMILVPGYEITKNSFINHRSAHLLILGTYEYISPDLPIIEILHKAKQLDAFVVAAHPFHTKAFEFQTFHLWSNRTTYESYIDAWEINSRLLLSDEVLASPYIKIANSDLHNIKNFESWKSNIDFDGYRISDLFKAIRNNKIKFFKDNKLSYEHINHKLPHITVPSFTLCN